MKKILTSLAIATLACASAHASYLTLFNFHDVMEDDDKPGATINLSGGGGVTTLGSGATAGYVAAFWWSATGAEGSYSAYGIGGFSDYGLGLGSDFDGTFFYESGGFPQPGTGFLGVTVFRVNDLVGADVAAWDSFFDLNGNGASIAALWDAAQTNPNGEVGDWWGAKITFDEYGFFLPYDVFGASEANGGFGWGTDKQYLSAVPEPSTWMLLGAGAAFVVLLRRRKKE